MEPLEKTRPLKFQGGGGVENRVSRNGMDKGEMPTAAARMEEGNPALERYKWGDGDIGVCSFFLLTTPL